MKIKAITARVGGKQESEQPIYECVRVYFTEPLGRIRVGHEKYGYLVVVVKIEAGARTLHLYYSQHADAADIRAQKQSTPTPVTGERFRAYASQATNVLHDMEPELEWLSAVLKAGLQPDWSMATMTGADTHQTLAAKG